MAGKEWVAQVEYAQNKRGLYSHTRIFKAKDIVKFLRKTKGVQFKATEEPINSYILPMMMDYIEADAPKIESITIKETIDEN